MINGNLDYMAQIPRVSKPVADNLEHPLAASPAFPAQQNVRRNDARGRKPNLQK